MSNQKIAIDGFVPGAELSEIDHYLKRREGRVNNLEGPSPFKS